MLFRSLMLAKSRTNTGVVRNVDRAMVLMGSVSAPGLAAARFTFMSASPSESMSAQSWRPAADKGVADEKAIAGRGKGGECGARRRKSRRRGGRTHSPKGVGE